MTMREPSDRQAMERMRNLLRQGRDVRRRQARRIGAMIRMRAYENDLKLEIAVDRLLDDLAVRHRDE